MKMASAVNCVAHAHPTREMVWVEGGEFRMGSDDHYPEEAPAHRVRVNGFFIDPCPVTNREFREFVRATGHVTFAEIAPDAKDYRRARRRRVRLGRWTHARRQANGKHLAGRVSA